MFRPKYMPVFFFYAVFFLAGCVADKVGLELVEYVNQGVLNVSQLEIKAWEHYGAVTGANYTTDEALYNALKNEVIPLYGRFADLLKQVRPQSDEVRHLHAVLVGGVEMIYNGFRSMLPALEKQDASLMQTANDRIEKGRIETEKKWHDLLLALYEAHGVRSAPKTRDSVFLRQLIEPPTN